MKNGLVETDPGATMPVEEHIRIHERSVSWPGLLKPGKKFKYRGGFTYRVRAIGEKNGRMYMDADWVKPQ